MKRPAIKRLKLTIETLRALEPGELANLPGALGGVSAAPLGNSCNSCTCHGQSGGCPM